MADDHSNLLLNLKVARDRKAVAPNKPLLVLAIDLGLPFRHLASDGDIPF